ncbi:hypothetical protein AVEN_248674-1 [Araneus ventricosus]|uniref:Uncharacterized protein n=1 Tax=Araneus ventricosus TaxID=182803 RepID=A0A4Y2C0S3_ARAVE|nr:hypothetical protein AVEN_248674-1 [Araneus ventricosus]
MVRTKREEIKKKGTGAGKKLLFLLFPIFPSAGARKRAFPFCSGIRKEDIKRGSTSLSEQRRVILRVAEEYFEVHEQTHSSSNFYSANPLLWIEGPQMNLLPLGIPLRVGQRHRDAEEDKRRKGKEKRSEREEK